MSLDFFFQILTGIFFFSGNQVVTESSYFASNTRKLISWGLLLLWFSLPWNVLSLILPRAAYYIQVLAQRSLLAKLRYRPYYHSSSRHPVSPWPWPPPLFEMTCTLVLSFLLWLPCWILCVLPISPYPAPGTEPGHSLDSNYRQMNK